MSDSLLKPIMSEPLKKLDGSGRVSHLYLTWLVDRRYVYCALFDHTSMGNLPRVLVCLVMSCV